MKGFTEITDQYRKKHYPKGYFAALVRRLGGMERIFSGAVLTVLVGTIGISRLIYILGSSLLGDKKHEALIILGLVLILFIGSGLAFLCSGIRSIWKGREKLIRKCMEISGYSESAVEEFEAQIKEPNAIAFQTHPRGETNILTADYLMWGISSPNLVKISDIAGIYLVTLPTAYFKRSYGLYIAIFSIHKNVIFLRAELDRAEYLTSLLLAKNPDIEKPDEVPLTREEYGRLVEEQQMRIRL